MPLFLVLTADFPTSQEAASNTSIRKQSNAEGKQKTTGKRCSQTPGKQSFCREVVLLMSPDDTKVVCGHNKAALHRTGNVISAFKFEKSWCFSTVCEELKKAFPQLGRIIQLQSE